MSPRSTLGAASRVFGTVHKRLGNSIGFQLPQEIDRGLILHYDFDGGLVGGKVRDRSGHGNDGVPTNVEFEDDGHRGGAAKFGLANSYVSVRNTEDLNSRQITIAVWINTVEKSRDWLRIVDNGNGTGYDLTMGGYRDGNPSRGQVWMEAEGGWCRSGDYLNDGQWHHLVGTVDGPNLTIYVDGLPAGTYFGKARGAISNIPVELTIGSNRSAQNPRERNASFNGRLDDLMIFNRVLSPSSIRTLFESQGGVIGEKPGWLVSTTSELPIRKYLRENRWQPRIG